MGNIREDIGGLKVAIATLTDTVRMQDARSADNRSKMYDKLDQMDRKLDQQEVSIKDLSRRVTEMEPSVSDYRTRMEQVKTAGWLGETLWKFGGILLAGAAGVASTYYAMTGRPPP